MKKILQVFVSAGILAYIISRVDFIVLVEKAGSLNLWLAMATIFIAHLDRSLMAYKWRDLIRSSGWKLTFRDALVTTYIGNFAGTFLPAGVGGDFVRVHLLRKMRLPAVEVVASIAIERLFGLLALVFISSLSLWLAELNGISMPGNIKTIVLWISLFVTGAVAVSFMGVFARIMGKLLSRNNIIIKNIRYVFEGYLQFSQRKRVLAKYLVLSLAEVVLVNVVFVALSSSLSLDIHFMQLFVIVPIVLLLQRIPVSLNGLGLQEGLLVIFFAMLGKGVEDAIVFGVFLRILEVMILLPGAFLFLQNRNCPQTDGPSAVVDFE